MKITNRQINNAIRNGYEVIVVINGEYYELENADEFEDGVKFAAAVLQDRRARSNMVFEGCNSLHPNKVTKKAIAENQARNREIITACDFLESITTGAGFSGWYQDYKAGKLWRLET